METKKNGVPLSCVVCKKTYYAKKSHAHRRKSCSLKCMGLAKRGSVGYWTGKKRPSLTGPNHPFWKGGEITDKYGYICTYAPQHPNAVHGRYVKKHRLVMEGVLKRYLKKSEVVHHINGIKTDNRPENLEVMTQSQHCKKHLPRLGTGKETTPPLLEPS